MSVLSFLLLNTFKINLGHKSWRNSENNCGHVLDPSTDATELSFNIYAPKTFLWAELRLLTSCSLNTGGALLYSTLWLSPMHTVLLSTSYFSGPIWCLWLFIMIIHWFIPDSWMHPMLSPAEVTHILYVVAANPPVTSSLFSSTSQRAHREVDVVISALKPSYSPVRRCWRWCRNAWARGWSWSFCCWEQNNSRQSVIREWVDCCLDQVVKVKRGVGESNMMGRATCNRWEV